MQGLSVWKAVQLMLEFKEEGKTWVVQKGDLTGRKS